MSRIFSSYAYGDGPRAGCWWDQTASLPQRPVLTGDRRVEVAIIGAGFTGLSAALHLAQAGVEVAVVDSNYVGWGASGRNGGFCCMGGGMLDDAGLLRRFGAEGRADWTRAELAAIDLVDQIITDHDIDIDRHSAGETELAHRPKDMQALRDNCDRLNAQGGVKATMIEQAALADYGMAGPFFGAMTLDAGFALNPRKYVLGLADAAEQAGAVIYHDTAVQELSEDGGLRHLRCGQGTLRAKKVIIATNGYSSDNLPDWLGDRYIPTQSSIIVTRPLTPSEIAAAGWSSDQMAFDTRNLLHYFRLMPDRRFLFGMRGGLMTGARAEAKSMARVRHDFEQMFPAWSQVETPYGWSGMVCIARDQMPFVGAVPNHPGVYAGLCYHGNGVAMGSYAGALLSDIVRDVVGARVFPGAMQRPLRRFGLGRARRALMPPAYLAKTLADR